jgi:RNA polymerase sigma factor (sigma-70 family)
MSNEIFKKVMNYREGDNESLIKIIELFNPLLIKYSKLLDGEDTKQDLIMHLISVVNKMKFDNKNLCEDKAIVGYVAKSIRNEYIRLSKKRNKILLNESELNLDIEIEYDDFDSEFEMLDTFKVLSEKEAYVMKLIYIHYLSVSEVSDYMKISRQGVNQAKNRALKKIRNMYLLDN